MTTRTRDLISAARLPHTATRSAELTLKRLTFRVENAAVLRLQALYGAAYDDVMAAIRQANGDRRYAEYAIAQRVERLKRDVLITLGISVAAALAGNYYGRLWQLSMAAHPDTYVHMPPLSSAAQFANLYGQQLQDVFQQAWAHQAAAEVDDLTTQIRRALGLGFAASALLELQKRIQAAMGIGTQLGGYRANFNRVQVLTRTLINTAATDGALTAYRVNPDVLDGYAWLTAEDERVCPQCRALDGKRFEKNPRFRPPLHPQCRCTLTPILKAGAIIAHETTIRVPLLEWLTYIGVAHELDDFMNPKR